ncbi:hypothetical protein VNO78_12814 [Psophocarpus tetragonolobus]|uniref:NB-ARC domain-containing protein n=1 Tax=Psophocarpus tetragonolobus TaxID=3891 RepID=A0AAN9SNI5_PSOTE
MEFSSEGKLSCIWWSKLMEFLFGFASSISRDLVCGAINQLRYPCCFNNLVEELAKEEANLIATRDSVQNRVSYAKKQTRKTAEVCDKWLKDANIDASNVNQLLKEVRTTKSSCYGYCPNWIWRSRLGKKLANRKRNLEKCIKEGRQYIEFESISTLPSGTHDLLSEKCLNFESRQPAYEQLMEALKDDDVAMIGLYGMGGCGKTTLAMEVRKKVEAEHLFDEVIFVSVSSTVEVGRIQEKIASSIQYMFPENEEMERAQRLYMRLTQENKILVILDDVWEKVDFGAIGIPSTEHHKGCKNLAREISDECKGLPVAIAAVASSLKGKAEVHNSMRYLCCEKIPNEFDCSNLELLYLYTNLDVPDGIFEGMRVLRVLFLYNKGDISFLGDVKKLESLTLHNCSFLELPHDVVRQLTNLRLLDLSECDMKRCPFEVIGRHLKLEELYFADHRSKWEFYNEHAAEFFQKFTVPQTLQRKLKSIFSACLSEGLPQLKELKIENCSQLQQIIENREDKKTRNPGSFKLPSLTRIMLKSCPILGSLFTVSVAETLTSLEELMIEDCHGLKHILIYGSAHTNKIEIMQNDHDFQSYVLVFPSLKKLSIMRCSLLQYVFPISFARCLGQLETIEIRETPELRHVFGQKIHSSHQHQNKFQIDFPVLEKVALHSTPNMIAIFPEKYYATCSSLQLLAMNDVGVSTISINNLMVDLEASHSDHSSKMDSRTMSMTVKPKLVSVIIENNSLIKEILHLEAFPINRQQVTPWIEFLQLVNLPELRYIWTASKHFLSLQAQRLHELHIFNCPKLKAIFFASMLRMLPLLKILVVEHCEELEQIIEDDDKENENVSNPQSPKVCFSQLKVLLVSNCNNLKHLFFISISHEFPELELLILNQNSQLAQVFEGEADLREGRVEVWLPNLKHAILMEQPNLINFCEGIEFQTVINLLVHSCPKFSVTSTTTVEDMLQTSNSDKEIDFYLRPHLLNISGITTRGYDVLPSKKGNKGTLDLQSWDQKLPPIPLSNMVENYKETKTTIIGEVSALAIPSSASILGRKSLTSSATRLYNISSDSIKDRILEEAPPEDVKKETLSAGVDVTSLDGAIVAHTKSSGTHMVPEFCVVEQGDKPDQHRRGTSPCQKIQNVDDSIQEGSNLIDKEGEIGVVSINSIVAQRNETLEKEFVSKVSTSEIPTIVTSFTNLELVERQSRSYFDIPLHITHSNSEIRHSQTGIYNAKESEVHPINILDFMANDIMSLFQPVEEDGEGLVTEDYWVVKALADLERCLTMPLKDIASSDNDTLHLLTALNFLSNLPLKDLTLSDGLKDIIDSMHKEFPNFLCSFKQSFAITDKLAVLESHWNEVASKLSGVKNFMDEAQEKEVLLKERIIRLKKEIEDCEADLSSLQEEKKKSIAETIRYKNEFENVRKYKSQMVKDQRKLQQKLSEVGCKWSALCSRF